MQHDPENIFDCEDSNLTVTQMDAPWYEEFARNFVQRQTRFAYWNAALRNANLEFNYTPEKQNKLADFVLNLTSPDKRTIPMVTTYLSSLPEITITRATPSQEAALDNDRKLYHAQITGKYHTVFSRGFEMYMKMRFRPSTNTFTIVLN